MAGTSAAIPSSTARDERRCPERSLRLAEPGRAGWRLSRRCYRRVAGEDQIVEQQVSRPDEFGAAEQRAVPHVARGRRDLVRRVDTRLRPGRIVEVRGGPVLRNREVQRRARSAAVTVPHICQLKFTRNPEVQAVTPPQLAPVTSPVVTVPCSAERASAAASEGAGSNALGEPRSASARQNPKATRICRDLSQRERTASIIAADQACPTESTTAALTDCRQPLSSAMATARRQLQPMYDAELARLATAGGPIGAAKIGATSRRRRRGSYRGHRRPLARPRYRLRWPTRWSLGGWRGWRQNAG